MGILGSVSGSVKKLTEIPCKITELYEEMRFATENVLTT